MPVHFTSRFRPVAAACFCLAALHSLQVHSETSPPRPLAPVTDNLRGPTASYIVTLNPDRLLTPPSEIVRDDRFALRPREWGYLNPRVVGDVQRYERKFGFKARHVYSRALMGFTANLTEAQVRALSRENSVFTVEPDSTVQTTQVRLPTLGGLLGRPPAPAPSPSPVPAPTPSPPPPLSQTPPPVPNASVSQSTPAGITQTRATLSWSEAGNGKDDVGTGPTVYVIDTGVANHPDLNVTSRINFAGGPDNDCNGHGTHVAGTAAALDNTIDVVGVAPGAAIVAVKVLDCNGSGATSNVMKGVDWVTSDAAPLNGPPKPGAVANMSLGGSISTALDNAVRNSAARGILYAIAAGNNSANACNYSPARLGGSNPNILVVAATDQAGREASFSNTGSCVDIWAPGVNVVSTNFQGRTSVLSGTSMASPHVAGASALIVGLARRNSQPIPTATEIRIRLLSSADPTGTTGKSVLLGGPARPVVQLDAEIN